MKFSIIHSYGSSHSTSAELHKIHFSNASNLTYEVYLKSLLVKDAESEEDEKVLEITFEYILFLIGNEILRFDSLTSYQISDYTTPPKEEDLKTILELCYKKLIEVFKTKKKEYHLLSLLQDIPQNTIEKALPQLKETLLPLYED